MKGLQHASRLVTGRCAGVSGRLRKKYASVEVYRRDIQSTTTAPENLNDFQTPSQAGFFGRLPNIHQQPFHARKPQIKMNKSTNKITLLFTILTTQIITGCASRALTPIFRPIDLSLNAVERKLHDDEYSNSINTVNLPALVSKNAQSLDDALESFRNECLNTNSQCKFKRNTIQDRLIAASNSICAEYKSKLKQEQANTNLNFGGASTIFGGLGAIAQSVGPARLYSGAAAMASGLRAEVNQNIYSMLAVEVITKAIDKTRKEALKAIDENQTKTIQNYTIERALADTMEYHGRCSVLAGLQEASTAVSQADNVGIDQLGKTLTSLGQTATFQVGKKNIGLGQADVLLMKSVCTNADTEYQSTISSMNINPINIDYKEHIENWNKIYNRTDICLNHSNSDSTASKADKEISDYILSYTTETDSEVKDQIDTFIKLHQNRVRETADSLARALTTLKTRLTATHAQIERTIAAVKVATSKNIVNSLNDSDDESVRKAKVNELNESISLFMSALAEINKTKSPLDVPLKNKVTAFIESVKALSTQANITEINKCITAQIEAINSLQNWTPR